MSQAETGTMGAPMRCLRSGFMLSVVANFSLVKLLA